MSAGKDLSAFPPLPTPPQWARWRGLYMLWIPLLNDYLQTFQVPQGQAGHHVSQFLFENRPLQLQQ